MLCLWAPTLLQNAPEFISSIFPRSFVTTIGSHFMFGCSSLVTADLSQVAQLQSVGDLFLAGCNALKTVNLSGLANCQRIGDGFLEDCSALCNIVWPPTMPLLEEVGDRFLKKCSALRVIDLKQFANVRSVGDEFLAMCAAATAVDLSPLTRVQSIGGRFLAECGSLEVLDLSPLDDGPVSKVGEGFLQGCSGLRSPPKVHRVKSLGKILGSVPKLEQSLDFLELTE